MATVVSHLHSVAATERDRDSWEQSIREQLDTWRADGGPLPTWATGKAFRVGPVPHPDRVRLAFRYVEKPGRIECYCRVLLERDASP